MTEMRFDGLRVLLSGAGGYLGSALACTLLRHGLSVSRICHQDPTLSIEEDSIFQQVYYLPRGFSQDCFDVFIHCATCYGRQGESEEAIRDANIRYPMEILKQLNNQQLLFINIDTALPASASCYARSKEEFRKSVRREFDVLRFLNVKLEQFYGPGDDSIVSRMIRSLQNHSPLELTLGEQERDVIFIDDVLSAMLVLLQDMQPRETGFLEVPLGSGAAFSIRQIAEVILALGQGDETSFRWGVTPYREHEVFYSCADVSYLNSRGWKPQFSLEQGIEQMLVCAETKG